MPQQLSPNPSSPRSKTTTAYYHGFQARVELNGFDAIFAITTAGQVYSLVHMSLPQAYELAKWLVETVEAAKKGGETNAPQPL